MPQRQGGTDDGSAAARAAQAGPAEDHAHRHRHGAARQGLQAQGSDAFEAARTIGRAAGVTVDRECAPGELREVDRFLDDWLVVVDTPDALLVTTSENAQRVKGVVDALKLTGRGDVL